MWLHNNKLRDRNTFWKTRLHNPGLSWPFRDYKESKITLAEFVFLQLSVSYKSSGWSWNIPINGKCVIRTKNRFEWRIFRTITLCSNPNNSYLYIIPKTTTPWQLWNYTPNIQKTPRDKCHFLELSLRSYTSLSLPYNTDIEKLKRKFNHRWHRLTQIRKRKRIKNLWSSAQSVV